MKSGSSVFTKLVIAFVLTMCAWTTAHAQDQSAMPPPPPPLADSTLLGWVGGTWGGDLTMGDQKMYGEAQFTLGLGQQWVEGKFGIWTDKTKTTGVPMGFMMYIRPGATAGSYKAVQIISDGSLANATATKSGANLNFVWTYDNGMKETGTLTKMGADHIVYKASVVDSAGAKVMDFQHELHRTKAK